MTSCVLSSIVQSYVIQGQVLCQYYVAISSIGHCLAETSNKAQMDISVITLCTLIFGKHELPSYLVRKIGMFASIYKLHNVKTGFVTSVFYVRGPTFDLTLFNTACVAALSSVSSFNPSILPSSFSFPLTTLSGTSELSDNLLPFDP